MQRAPIDIVEEFLRSSDPQVRRNALTALGVIDDKASIDRLVSAALTDTDGTVRRRAEEELMALSEKSQDRVSEALYTGLLDERQCKGIYILLGSLRAQGQYIAISSLKMSKRLSLSVALFSSLYPVRDWKFWFRSCMPGLRGSILGIAVYLIFLMMLLKAVGAPEMDARMTKDLWGILLLGPLFAIFACQRILPINLYYDRLSGALIEIGRAAAGAAMYGALLIWFLLIGEGLRDTFTACALAFIAFPAFAAAIRGGTLLAAGVFTQTNVNRSVQIAVGSATGLLVVTCLDLLIRQWGVADIVYENWFHMIPFGFALAYAYATIDTASVPLTPVGGKAGRLLSFALPGIVVFAALLAVLPLPNVPSGPIVPHFGLHPVGATLQVHSDEPFEWREHIKALPYRKDIESDTIQNIAFALEGDRLSQRDQAIVLIKDKQSSEESAVLALASHPAKLVQEVEPGHFFVVVDTFSAWETQLLFPQRLAARNVLPLLIERLRRTLATGPLPLGVAVPDAFPTRHPVPAGLYLKISSAK